MLDTSMMGLKPETACEGGYDEPRPSKRLAVRTPGVGVEVYGRGWTCGWARSFGGLLPGMSSRLGRTSDDGRAGTHQ